MNLNVARVDVKRSGEASILVPEDSRWSCPDRFPVSMLSINQSSCPKKYIQIPQFALEKPCWFCKGFISRTSCEW
jgi:hypothetical protein